MCNLELDLKPENLLFRTQAEDADIMIADFGLSRIMEEERLNQLTEICGTPGVSSLGGFRHFPRTIRSCLSRDRADSRL